MSEAVETPEGNQPQLNEQEKASLQKAREGLSDVNPNVKPAEGPQRPEGIPDKFWDAEKGEVRIADLTTSYAALEAKLSAPAEAEANAEGEAEGAGKAGPGGKIEKAAEANAEGEAEANPLTDLLGAAASDYESSQGFSEETVEKLVAAGIPPEIQQVYLAGLSAIQNEQTSTVQGFVGGEDNYNAMANWAAQKLTDGELEKFNASLGDKDLAENAVRGLFARYKAANPSEGRQVAPQNGAPSNGDTFANKAEFKHALADARYQTDPSYRSEVVAKLARTRKAGIRITG